MLYLVHCANHSEMKYRGGQDPILHLELELHEVLNWADARSRRWAFTLSNAGATYTEFRRSVDELDQVNWPAVASTDFKDPGIKEGKQAEFLVALFVPWHLVRRIGVSTPEVQREVIRRMAGAAHRPSVEFCRSWYF